MFLLKTIRVRHFHALLQLQIRTNYFKNVPQNPLPISSNSYQFCCLYSISWKPFPVSAEFSHTSEEKSPTSEKPLSEFFKHAVGISDTIEDCGAVKGGADPGNAELVEKLRNLEEEVRNLSKKNHGKGSSSKLHLDQIVRKGHHRCLSALFGDKKMEMEEKFEPTDFGSEDTRVHKELSPDMQSFAYCLHKGGYLKNANFMPGDKFDSNCFEASYAREYLKFAAVKFGKDHQEIAKWLSATDLKKVALFGCPSLGQKTVYAAKHLRGFFKIEEHKVCQTCILKESCKLSNKKTDVSKLCLSNVTRVLVMYALESVPRQLVVPEEIKISVSRLLKEVINLSETVSS